MALSAKKYPFEASPEDLSHNIDTFVDSVFEDLSSEFLVLPKGPGYISYKVFETGYETLKRHSENFARLRPETVVAAAAENAVVLIVLRTILGFTPPEWAHVAEEKSGVAIPQNFARDLDRDVRLSPEKGRVIAANTLTGKRTLALVDAACELINSGRPPVDDDVLHRLDKADTGTGLDGVHSLATLGVPYAVLLYERFLGRPFAGHRDAISQMIGDVLETPIEAILHGAGITFRKTKRAEKLPGFDQAPDFVVPTEFNPLVVIEAKICEDDGTARDKVTRVQHLAEMSRQGAPIGQRKYQVIVCIGGRGFRVRREDMKKLLIATDGKVFTARTLHKLIDSTDLARFATQPRG
jgi:hypothetical protein